MPNEPKWMIIGYGDPECTIDCTFRAIEPMICDAMVAATQLQIEAARAGDWPTSYGYEQLQNQFWTQLGCEPGRLRA